MADGVEAPVAMPRLLYFIPEDWYVCSHRLNLVEGAVAEGWEVVVVTRVQRHGPPIAAAGARVIPTRLRRGFRNPWHEIVGFWHLVRIYRRERPDLVHHVTPKSCLFGSLAAALTGVPQVVNALAGLGFLFSSTAPVARLLRPVVKQAFRLLLGRGRSRVIVQNGEDRDFFATAIGIRAENIVLIRGSGVDTTVFAPKSPPPPPPVRCCLVARMIREKGLDELVAAARLLLSCRDDVEIVLAGDTDRESPSGIAAATLRGWQDEGLVTWLGRVADIPALLNSCHVAVLPTYREGLPKSLLEAAACGLPLVATDVPGCREVCHHQVNGILVPARDAAALAEALAKLADDPPLRARLGAASRQLVETDFAEEIVVRQTMALYRELTAAAGR